MGAAKRPRVLIAGGGYVGMYTALGLERELDPNEADIELVAPENFMCYQPLLPEVASGSAEPRHVVIALRKVLRRTNVTLGRLASLDHPRRTATIETGAGDTRETGYDVVILGIGAVTKLLPIPGLTEHAVSFQTLTEAIHLRNQVLSRLEVAAAAADPEVRRRALTFVFVGGGYAGVEGLAELEHLAEEACRDYSSISPEDMRWVLIEATAAILPTMREKLGRRAEELLRNRGIELHLETVLESAEDGTLCLSDGQELSADTLVWMPGVSPNPLAGELGLPCDEQGRLVVDQCMRVQGEAGVWAAGDCAAIPDGEGGTHPPTAQHAEREARHLAKNIARTLRKQSPEPFRYRSRGEFITLGNRKAIGRIFALQMAGSIAWLLRRAYYLGRMPSIERRIRLALDWLANLPFSIDVVQLGAEEHPDEPLVGASQSQ